MNGVDVLRFGFNDASETLDGVMKDVTQEMADFLPPNLADPIAWNYLHTAYSNDWTIRKFFQDKPLIWETEDWDEKFGFAMPMFGQKDVDPHKLAHTIKIPLDLAREYTQAVNQIVNDYLDTLDDADLDRVVPSHIENSTLGQIFSLYINWHVAAHAGEIAVLKGIQGHKGYGF